MSGAGQMDRRNEGAYLAEMRQIARDIELTAARQLRTFQREMGRMECDFRLTSELKWQLSRSKKETEILAGDDPVLQAKMAIIEDDQFQRMRAYVIDAFDD